MIDFRSVISANGLSRWIEEAKLAGMLVKIELYTLHRDTTDTVLGVWFAPKNDDIEETDIEFWFSHNFLGAEFWEFVSAAEEHANIFESLTELKLN